MSGIEVKPDNLLDINLNYNTINEQIMSSSVGALLTSLFMTPFDVVKTRLQVQERSETRTSGICSLVKNCVHDNLCHLENKVFCCRVNKNPFKGTYDAFVKIPKYEGVSSLWSGLVPTLIISVPSNVMYFTMYDQFHKKLESDFILLGSHSVPILAGISARVLTVTLVCPVEFLRTKLQSEKLRYSDIFKGLSDLVKHKGFIALWHGWIPTIYRDATFSALYWSIYEEFKRSHPNPKFIEHFFFGAIAGTVSAVLTLPLDVIKTLRQSELCEQKLISGSKSPSTWSLFIALYRNRGLKSLFAGIVPRILKVGPSCAIMISSYEVGKLYFKQKKMKSPEDKMN